MHFIYNVRPLCAYSQCDVDNSTLSISVIAQLSLSGCSTQYDIAFIMDFSGSVDDVYTLILTFVRHVIYGLEFRFDTARVGIVTFDTEAQISFTLDRYQEKEDILNALAFRREGGKTNTAEALRLARTEVKHLPYTKVSFVLWEVTAYGYRFKPHFILCIVFADIQ